MRFKGIKPYPKQREIIDYFADSKHKFGVVSATRGAGKSLLAQNMMLYWLLNNPKSKGGYITPVYAQSRNVFDEVVRVCHPAIEKSNRADLTIKFLNGSNLRFLSTQNPDSIRGYRFHYLVIDEASFIREEAITEAVLPTMNPSGRKCLVVSTPKHKASWFYKWYVRGLDAENSVYKSFKIGLHDSPYADLEFIEEQRKSLPTDIFRAEYEAEFVDSSSDVFRGLDNVCVLNGWTEPRKAEKYYLGADIGLRNDYTAITILNEAGRCVFIDRINQLSLEAISNRIIELARKYNVVGGFIERNGIGEGVFELASKQIRTIKPFITTQDSKGEAIQHLIYSIEQMEMELPSKDFFPILYNELSMYTYKVSTNGKISFSHPSGAHDDTLDSLWLANEARLKMKNRGSGAIRIGKVR